MMNTYVTDYNSFMFKVDAHMRIGIAIRKPELSIERNDHFPQVKLALVFFCSTFYILKATSIVSCV